jgi:DNA end-binding protein Ku
MARPYWSGQIQISLVSFGVSFFTATEAASEIAFHQIDRKTGERIRHRNVSEDRGAVEKADIVKGYEYRKGEYVTLEPEEIAKLRIPSKKTLQITQFVDIAEIDPAFFEKPYFVVPESDAQAEAFAVIQKALRDTNKAGLGEAAFAGREHLIAIMPPNDLKSRGLMAYSMRYAAELRDPADYFDKIPQTTIDKGQLSLAQELIRRNTAKFTPEKYVDDYEAALRKLVDAKIAHKPLPEEKPAPRRAKVINLMDALRKSVGENESSDANRRTPAAKAESGTHRGKAKSGGLKLVKPAARRKRTA